MKIRHPKQKPLKIITILADNEDSLEFNGQRVQIPGLQEGMQLAEQLLKGINPEAKKEEKKAEEKPSFSKKKEEKKEEK